MTARSLLLAAAEVLLGAFSVSPVSAQQQPLPRVVHAWAPVYPLFGPESGTVALRVTTDGNRVVRMDEQSAPNRLLAAAKDNVRSWQFEPHQATSFGVQFSYRMAPSACKCKTCGRAVTESIVMRLPTSVDVTGIQLCDVAVDRSWGERRSSLLDLPKRIGEGFVRLFTGSK